MVNGPIRSRHLYKSTYSLQVPKVDVYPIIAGSRLRFTRLGACVIVAVGLAIAASAVQDIVVSNTIFFKVK